MGQQYLQVYGVPGAVNTPVYQYGQFNQTVPSGQSYTALQGYSVPGSHVLQLGGSTVSAMTTSSMPALQAPYPPGVCLLSQASLAYDQISKYLLLGDALV